MPSARRSRAAYGVDEVHVVTLHRGWRKSSYSIDKEGSCVEVWPIGNGLMVMGDGQAWCKSSYTPDEGPNCVEIRAFRNLIAIGDSKGRCHGALTVPSRTWRHFTRAVRHDHPAAR
ncbi:DUF397 domain-containing protein [Streptomyces sp. UNOC14_S4]|nr:DUF397 domain-containing protein [Streptomyces sp. UNOC14_S4]